MLSLMIPIIEVEWEHGVHIVIFMCVCSVVSDSVQPHGL